MKDKVWKKTKKRKAVKSGFINRKIDKTQRRIVAEENEFLDAGDDSFEVMPEKKQGDLLNIINT